MDPEMRVEAQNGDGAITEPSLRARLLELLAELDTLEVNLPERVESTLAEMEDFQQENPRMWNISREGGKILYHLVKKYGCKNILEIGTSNGYSTVWLAQAASEVGGHVQSFEKREQKVALAKENLKKADLDGIVDLVESEATEDSVDPDTAVDILFMDILPEEYLPILKKMLPKMKSPGIIVADNLNTNRYQGSDDSVKHEEAEDYLDFVRSNPSMASTILDVGSGLQIILYEQVKNEV